MNGIEWLGVIIMPFVVVALGWPMALLWRSPVIFSLQGLSAE